MTLIPHPLVLLKYLLHGKRNPDLSPRPKILYLFFHYTSPDTLLSVPSFHTSLLRFSTHTDLESPDTRGPVVPRFGPTEPRTVHRFWWGLSRDRRLTRLAADGRSGGRAGVSTDRGPSR